MNEWERFLKSLKNETQLTLVGPLYNRRHVPEGPTVYVDGGLDYYDGSNTSSFSTISVGDGDSAAQPMDVLLPDRKDFSDLAFVLRHVPDNIKHVSLIGFLGGRSDHELINFGEVHAFLAKRTKFTSVNFDLLVYAFTGGALSLNINGIFSLVVFSPTMITVVGACEYEIPKPLRFETLTSLGLSNKGFGAVTVDCLAPCFIFLS